MQVAIVSGKGGTGKSCVASALALASGNCVFVDADVDCPNQHLLFKGRQMQRKWFSASKIAVIGNNRPGNRDYGAACEFRAIARKGDRLAVLETRCEGCGACSVAFPELDIRLAERKSGETMITETKLFPLVHGRLVPGMAGSGKVVFELKRMARGIASRQGLEDILIDAPAGIGCPVISALAGCDHAIGVVEPTPASISNLERALDMARHFDIPFLVVMNKQGISKSNEREIARRYGRRLVASIPYDEEVPRLLAKGKPPSLGSGAAAKALREMAVKSIRMMRGGAH
jgi:MinD superfamily P-loop ATPase